jgi:hypothetical protein
MSKNMSSTGQRYEAAASKFDSAVSKYETETNAALRDYKKAYNKYAGEAGLKSATDYAEKQANQQSQRAGNQAAANATRGASTSGLNKAQAAMMGRQAASDTTGNMYQGVYDSSRGAALNNNQATLAAKQGEYGTRVNAAGTPLNARGQQMTAAQQEDQNAYNRSWGNLGGIGSMFTGLLTSDERLKTFKEVSSKLDSNPKEVKDDYTLLKVSYKKENK